MKKLLSILGVVGLMATTGISVVACAPNNKKNDDTDDGDDAEDRTEIKLQVNASIINIDETLDIKIENYSQIKEKLKDFTLEIDQQGTLEPVGEFDQKAGKFVVKGLNQGTVKVTVQTYYQDKSLGQAAIESSLTIYVIPAEAQQIGITSNKIELEPGYEDSTTIKIDDYQNIKSKWKDFILTITTLESSANNQEVLRQTETFDKEKGEFKVWASFPGKVKINVFATPIDEARNQNFANQTSTLTNEIIITVKKYDFESFAIGGWKEFNFLGYGLTGNEFIKVINRRSFGGLLKYSKDYEILNLNREEKLKQGTTLEFKAKESSKIVTGGGKLTLLGLDIWVLKEKTKGFEVGLTQKEFDEAIKKEMKNISEKAIYHKDYDTHDLPLFVGQKLTIHAGSDSELLAGDVEIPVIGDSYGKWGLDKLNEQAKSFIKTMNDLIKENEDTDYPEPIDNPDLQEQWAKNYFEMHCFFARVFLETKYAVMNLDNEEIEIKEVEKTSPDYDQAKAELREKLNDLNQVGNNEEYVSLLPKYASILWNW